MNVEEMIEQKFVCQRCSHQGAIAQKLSMSGTGLSRLFDVQPYRYTFVSCQNCGYTEVFNLDILEGKDDVGTFLDAIFAG